MLTINDLLTSSDKFPDRKVHCPEENLINAEILVQRVNKLLGYYGSERGVRSGYRTVAANTAARGAKGSHHLTCCAVDLDDSKRTLGKWCLENLELLVECGLYLESPKKTPTWVHLQIKPPKSGNRVFLP